MSIRNGEIMGRKKKNLGIGGVSFSNRGRKGRGKKGLDGMSNMGALGERAFKSFGGKRNGSSRGLEAIKDWFSKMDYLDERRRVMDEMEQNPQAIAQQIRENRVMQVPGTSPISTVLEMITRASLRIQRRETKLDNTLRRFSKKRNGD
jgi:hypothetical protein